MVKRLPFDVGECGARVKTIKIEEAGAAKSFSFLDDE
jgi:hypothetical protein